MLSSIFQDEAYSKLEKHIQFSVKSQLCFKGGWGINGLNFVVFFVIFKPIFQPGRVAQSVGHLTCKLGVLGSIPGL